MNQNLEMQGLAFLNRMHFYPSSTVNAEVCTEFPVNKDYLYASQPMLRQYQNKTRKSPPIMHLVMEKNTLILTCVVTHEALIIYQFLMPDS